MWQSKFNNQLNQLVTENILLSGENGDTFMTQKTLNIILTVVSVIMVGNFIFGVMTLEDDWAVLVAWFFPVLCGMTVQKSETETL